MEERAQRWFRKRTSVWKDWRPEWLLERKERTGLSVSVVVPARNEADTVGDVVHELRKALVLDIPLVDELVVMDSDSLDATGAVAAKAGATVYLAREVAADLGAYFGKGEALWKSLFVTKGDLLVFVDADLTSWGPHFVTGLLGPLLADDDVTLVKGFYERVRTEIGGSTSTEGGRVTELVARPILSLWWPELAGVVQPLAGEWSIRRSLIESLSVPIGYGIELSTLLDTAARHGLQSVAQVDLGSRAHKHQSNHDLALMAGELLLVAERRKPSPQSLPTHTTLDQFVRNEGKLQPVSRPIPTYERPPAQSVQCYERPRPQFVQCVAASTEDMA